MAKLPTCNEKVECFAKVKKYVCGFEIPKCNALSRTDFGERSCPFAKPKREMTNGVVYPYDPVGYSEMLEDKV